MRMPLCNWSDLLGGQAASHTVHQTLIGANTRGNMRSRGQEHELTNPRILDCQRAVIFVWDEANVQVGVAARTKQ